MEQESIGGSLEKTFSALTVDDVYEIAKLFGSDVEKLIDEFGQTSMEGLVCKIIKVLEFLESFVAKKHVNSMEEELIKEYEMRAQQQKKQLVKECEDDAWLPNETADLEQKLQEWQWALVGLQAQVVQLQEEKQELVEQLRCSRSQRGFIQQQEREMMLKLKAEVVKQRDTIRAKAREIVTVSEEAEALQEQLERFMNLNAELRHKQSIAQVHVKNAVECRAVLEADLCEKQKEVETLKEQLNVTAANSAGSTKAEIDLTDKMIVDLKDPNRPCFTKQEVWDLVFERNALKVNHFLAQEELSYYQREILNNGRCPSYLLDAVCSAIRKQRAVIKAKMLGTPVEEHSSDEEDNQPFSKRKDVQTGTDCTDGCCPQSCIRKLLAFLTCFRLDCLTQVPLSEMPTRPGKS